MEYMRAALKGRPEELPVAPEGVVAAAINPDTGLRDSKAEHPMIEYFYHENVPPEQEGDDFSEDPEIRPAEEISDQLY
jgi:membrane carboxypeptidase/penicillin-binding protein